MNSNKCTCTGDGFTCPACLAKPRKRPTDAPKSELAIQRECVAYFRRAYPDIIITSIRNEAKYSHDQKHYGALANRAGRHAGIADLLILTPRLGWSALFVELKTPQGRQSSDQERFAAYCVKHGYMYAIARNIDEFKQIVTEYLT
jgi:hypothetical protein